ncbi:cytochrome c oxidase subunit 3 [Mesorhizobium sp.]|uniref:cytochrome c oxidase subunit 3 n=1 Tax=Mesorhizobium sp. TaxID=1871066 RepID=UPI000FE91467|nr:cytochrome c oxidase subunit 3 [Mesorhizobium sp.]RWM30149.1 MAG: cytochrome-c oxidase [Mesorhizobium sp.]RWM38641.1 MAG: cytochrome-c oxidase [Mesorhizobium sp.]TIO75635.1 MAG: cytochrome-c oxidase [Mesorhizobium sp.]TIO83668.1 MAG: cytochrome-c oxidase [Mesorhizobium sp.]TJV50374.1 MAG: cytochrome-c oxidase [Mesorhizobium sp.]
MSVILVFLLVIAGFAVWWLSHQRLLAKPWLEQGMAGDFVDLDRSPLPTAKIGLGVFLAVVGCLFSLFTSAYFMRMGLSDWRPLPLPRLLWLNTGVLVLSSVALQCAVVAARRGQLDMVKLGLATAGLTALAFLAGQLVAWRQLTEDGYLLASNPANSFFYLITAMHGLHIMGGLVGLGRTSASAWNGARPERLRLGVELCAMYWHFLLFVWLGIFAVLAGWAATIIDICQRLLT